MDERRRVLERELVRGDPAVAAAALADRVRRGEVSPDAVRVAALLGEARAREVLPPGVNVEPGDLPAIVAALKAAPGPVVARAAIAVARVRLPADEVTLLALVRAAEAWVLCPCKPCESALSRQGARLPLDGSVAALSLVVGWPKKALSDVVSWSTGAGGRTPDEVLAGLRAELVPWLLGEGDPLHARAGAPLPAPDPPEAIALREPPPPRAPSPPPPPPTRAVDAALERGVDAILDERRARQLRILRGRSSPPSAEEVVTETFVALAARLPGFALTSRTKRAVVLARAVGEWTERLHFTTAGALGLEGLSVRVTPRPATLSSPALAAWRAARGGAKKEADTLTEVPLRLATTWEVADPHEGERFVDAVVDRVTKITLPRLARLRDPHDVLHELLDLTSGPRGFSAPDVEAIAWLAGDHAAREYARRWRTKRPTDHALADVVDRLALS